MFRLTKDGRGAMLLVEPLMIVVGINVALWFEGWFQDLQDDEIAARYLEDLRDDLATDIEKFDKVIEREC